MGDNRVSDQSIHHPTLRHLLKWVDRRTSTHPVETERAIQSLSVEVRHRALLAAWYVGCIGDELREHGIEPPDGIHPDASTAVAAWFYADERQDSVKTWLADRAAEASSDWGDHALEPLRIIERALLSGFTIEEIERRLGLPNDFESETHHG